MKLITISMCHLIILHIHSREILQSLHTVFIYNDSHRLQSLRMCPHNTLPPFGALIGVQAQSKGHPIVLSASRLEQPSSKCRVNKIHSHLEQEKNKSSAAVTVTDVFSCFF